MRTDDLTPPLVRQTKPILQLCTARRRLDGLSGFPGRPPPSVDLRLLVSHDPLQPPILTLELLQPLTSLAFGPPYWADDPVHPDHPD